MTIYSLPSCRRISALPRGCAVALGNFDGVHRGHQRIFELARASGAPAVAWTFTTLAKPGLEVPYITDMNAKLELFAEYGLDYAVFEDFENVRGMAYDDFARSYICGQLGAARAVCGFNFRFGRGGTGDAQQLRELLAAEGVPVDILNPVIRRNRIVSSSAVREAVEAGDMDAAYDLLGHPFAIKFPVQSGKHFGRSIGIPTINQDFPHGHIIPRFGIYACTVKVGTDVFTGAANVGVRPTVSGNGHINCETHIINYSGILYGKEILVSFYKLLRDERRFASTDELAAQIRLDIEHAGEYFTKLYGG